MVPGWLIKFGFTSYHQPLQGTPNKGHSCRFWLHFPKIRSDKKLFSTLQNRRRNKLHSTMTVFKTFHPCLSNILLSKLSCHFMVLGLLIKFGFTSSIIDLRKEHQTRVIHSCCFWLCSPKIRSDNKNTFFGNKLHFAMKVFKMFHSWLSNITLS